MPYDIDDPRAQLSTATATMAGIPRAATYVELERLEGRTRWVRSQAMLIGHTRAVAGDRIVSDIDAEHVLLVVDGAAVRVDDTTVDDDSVVVLPPGPVTIDVTRAGTLVRILAADTAPDLAALAVNAADYAERDPNVATFAAWPAPPAGYDVRAYRLADFPPEPGRLGAIFRCSTVMVNVFPPDDHPRDPTKLSPHSHDDFEQVSLQLAGDYVHHMRVPWTPDSSTWRDDQHQECTSPAVVVIPPPLIHTTQALGEMRHWLVDVFAPPRVDFSQRPGWVLNADDYPMPGG